MAKKLTQEEKEKRDAAKLHATELREARKEYRGFKKEVQSAEMGLHKFLRKSIPRLSQGDFQVLVENTLDNSKLERGLVEIYEAWDNHFEKNFGAEDLKFIRG